MISPEREKRDLEGPAAPPPSPPPPKGPRALAVLAVLAVACALFAAGVIWGRRSAGAARPSHEAQSAHEGHAGETTYYTCGMHPWVILPAPGLCPVCRMELTPITAADFTGEVTIDPRVVQNIGVRIGEVVKGPLVRTIRTLGSVVYDETRVRDVNIKVNGWIEDLHVDFVGARVEKGQPLFELFSRELYDTQQQYLLSLRNPQTAEPSFLPEATADRARLVESSRLRLEYYDISPEQVEELEERGEPRKTMTIVSPHEGVVISKHANEGMLVDPGMLVYRIADLSKVWVLVTLYEYQLPYVSVGQRAVITLPYIPGVTFEGRVIYKYPFLEEKTREVQVRLELDNPDLLLKPGMFANIELKSVLAEERPLAPRSAIIDTGERQVAFVSLGGGRFEPRDVRTGVETKGGRVEVLDGLRPGELVVTSAQFLLDSEAKIREALAKMVRGDLAAGGAPPGSGPTEVSSLPPAAAEALSAALESYFAIGELLAADRLEGKDAPARELAAAIGRLIEVEVPDDPHFWHRHDEAARARGKALELIQDAGIAEARETYSDLSVALAKLVRATGVPPSFEAPVEELHCPMYREGQGGTTWLQPRGEVRNPYFGARMLRCFDERKAMPVAGSEE